MKNADIILATLNARYSHASLALRYLMANLGKLASSAMILEFDLRKPTDEIVEAITARCPKIAGVGVYIWNIARLREILPRLRQAQPGIIIVLGGPEAGHNPDPAFLALADYVVEGEGDLTFARLCGQLLNGNAPENRRITGKAPDLSAVALPYSLYTPEDIAHRTLYVETSRGCPFECEYCLSSGDRRVRFFDLDRLLPEFERLLAQGARHLKFVDRTFNLDLPRCIRVLDFFLGHRRPGLFLHFEMVPDRFPEDLRAVVKQFPQGMIQFEIGIQTWNPDVAERIKRRQDHRQAEDNLRYLREQTHVFLHTDLIAGLPGETFESFAAGFDHLAALRPHEIQVGILKRLHGCAIGRHDAEWGMTYNPEPPYNLTGNRLLGPEAMARIARFAHTWDRVANSGNFPETAPMIWAESDSVFGAFLQWSEWLFRRTGRVHSLPLTRVFEELFCYLTEVKGLPADIAGPALARDYRRPGRKDLPACLRAHVAGADAPSPAFLPHPVPRRQARHWASPMRPATRE